MDTQEPPSGVDFASQRLSVASQEWNRSSVITYSDSSITAIDDTSHASSQNIHRRQATEFNADLAEAESSQPNERQGIAGISTPQSDEEPPDLTPNHESLEDEVEDIVAASSMQEARLPILQSLGIYACLILIGGSILLLPVIGYLLFLWTAGDLATGGQNAPAFWRTIVVENWAVRSITLSSLALRIITAAQVTICTSMTAALLLERRTTPTSKAALLSVFRGVNDGPLRLFKELFWSKPVSGITLLETHCLVLLALASAALQFSSTVLLSDLNTATLVQSPQRIQVNVGATGALDKAINSNSASVDFASGPYQTFGEQETVDNAVPNANGVSDTGLKSRAFLPFNDVNRTTLRSFKGPTASITTRTSCVAPSIQNLALRLRSVGNAPYFQVTGNISWDETWAKAGQQPRNPCIHDEQHDLKVCFPTQVACSLSVGLSDTPEAYAGQWQPSLCHLPVSPIETVHFATGRWDVGTDMWDANRGWPFLTMATNVREDHLELNETDGDTILLGTPSRHEEWSSYTLTAGTFINITLCSAGLYMGLADVELSTSMDPREPGLLETILPAISDVDDIQAFLGAASINLSPQKRGLLSIDAMQYVAAAASLVNSSSSPPTSADKDLYLKPGNMTDNEFGSFLQRNSIFLWGGPASAVLNWGVSGNFSLNTCSYCEGIGAALSSESALVFTQIINTTGRSALAIESLLFHFASIWYYGILSSFNYPADVEVSFSAQYTVPTHWNGLAAVLSLVAVHFFCVWFIAGLYFKHTRYTRQGNIWQTVSQLISEQTQPMLGQSNELKDEDVTELLRDNNPCVTLGRSSTGRVELLKCEQGHLQNDTRKANV
ncbi:hypothetical protein F5B21DRAFT_455849 [Xylaria acuta]|nr:hypothetical protein F5B21DRAFT_455849 [Xylaria acuta]